MGKFIAIDGLDGSGKGTQSEILVQRLQSEGKRVRVLSFPMYENDSSLFVRMYLDGKLGDKPSDTNAYAASMFFGSDRYISYVTDWKKDILDPDTYVVANRYTTANAVHQLSKLPESEWEDFLKWLWDFEFSKLGLPEPDLVLYLELPPRLSLSLVKSRSDSTGQKMDIHEKDTEYMAKCYEAALYSCKKLGWKQIKCYNGDIIRTREDIAEEIYKEVGKL
ncbi:MAG: thymidylate kinase [Ruminococcaceae bacterium]|nr:thymidylate kinase [Oscillospiraceae bacterium]